MCVMQYNVLMQYIVPSAIINHMNMFMSHISILHMYWFVNGAAIRFIRPINWIRFTLSLSYLYQMFPIEGESSMYIANDNTVNNVITVNVIIFSFMKLVVIFYFNFLFFLFYIVMLFTA